MFKEIVKCRICQNEDLVDVLDLGTQALSGIFPKSILEEVPSGPLQLIKCAENTSESCGLVQLRHNYNPELLYGTNYGYRSSLNNSMVTHLHNKVKKILSLVNIEKDDYILDIGSNDGTTLKGYPDNLGNRIGVDPTGDTFRKYYPPNIDLIADFFSAEVLNRYLPNFKAKVITSIAMFYDLEDPLKFVKEIKEVLSEDGIWVFEQSYLHSMLQNNSFDTVCHEHIEYYSLRQIYWMCEKTGLRIIDVEFNDINGGSFSIVVTHKNSRISSQYEQDKKVFGILENEKKLDLQANNMYELFSRNVVEASKNLKTFLNWTKSENRKVFGLGASTKGNVIIQYCNITSDEIISIGEVNQDKFGSYTPGSKIPIVPEWEILNDQFDYLIVFPWHFKNSFMHNEKYKNCLHKMVFPLPRLSTIQGELVIPS